MNTVHSITPWRRVFPGACRIGIALLCLISTFLAAPTPASAMPGDLVPGFGLGGLVTTNLISRHEDIASLAMLPDGKIIAGGTNTNDSTFNQFLLARYNSDGSVDTTFGECSYGCVTASFGTGKSTLKDITIQPDGKIVAAGQFTNTSGSSYFALARFCPDGLPDTGTNCPTLLPKFGQNGKVITQAINGSTLNYAQAVVMQGDGKIVAGGSARSSVTGSEQFALVRYNTNGSLDTSFDLDGRVTTALGPMHDEINDLVLYANQIIAVGASSDAEGHKRFALARYNINGSLDAAFDGDGMVTSALAGDSAAFSIAVQPSDSRLVAAGYATSALDPFPTGFAVARYNSNGSLDPGFGASGSTIIYIDPSVQKDYGNSLALDGSSRILVGGHSFPDSSGAANTENAALVRLCPDGTLDTGGKCSPFGFSDDGMLVSPIGAAASSFRALVVRSSDGNILAAGRSVASGSRVFTMGLFESGPSTPFAIAGNTGAPGVTLNYTDGFPRTVVSDANGNYVLGVTSGWSGIVTPSKDGFNFTPPNIPYFNVMTNQTGQNYQALVNAPLALPATDISCDRFTANWVAAPDLNYRLDVATDPAFTMFVPGYQGLVVANAASYPVTGLVPNTPYYYRVSAYTPLNTGLPSEAITVVTWPVIYLPVIMNE